MSDPKESVPCNLDRMRRVAVVQESHGGLLDAEVTRTLCEEVERLRTLNAQLADRLAICSGLLTKAADRDYDRRNAAYRQGQKEVIEILAHHVIDELNDMEIRDLPSGGAGGGG